MNRYRMTIFVTASILMILLLACAPAAKQGAAVTVTCEQFSKQANIVKDVAATAGSTITVTLAPIPPRDFSGVSKLRSATRRY